MKRVVTLIILMAFILPVFADTPYVTCPPGFTWQSWSGVGCMQSDCGKIKGSGYTDTQECWCGETKRACYEYVNYSGFDAKLCRSFCPVSRLIACADANGRCPNDKPAQNQTQVNTTPATPTQSYCDDYCMKLEGPHASSTIQNNICQCGCKDGYTNENSEVLLCQPTKATCDNYCKSYHGGDKSHGDSAYGTVMGTDCDCHCKPGYVPDNTLTCVKDNSCSDLCLKQMGAGAIATGIYPNCNCDCKVGYTKVYNNDKEWKLVCKKVVCPANATFDKNKGECVCNEGFNPTPLDGVCIKKFSGCNPDHCDLHPPQGVIIEDCELCPKNCGCASDEICSVNHPDKTIENRGCIKVAAQLVEIGCSDGSELPTVKLTRNGEQNESDANLGVRLAEGDQLTIGSLGNKNCTRPFITLQWGNTRGRLMLGNLQLYTLTVKNGAVESGWPEITKGEVAWSAWEIISTVLIESSPLHVAQMLLFTSAGAAGERDAVKVYVESHLIINQTFNQDSSNITVYTISGSPDLEYKSDNLTVYKGMKVTVDANGIGTPSNFTASDVGDWYLRFPTPLAYVGTNTSGTINENMPDFGNIVSQISSACCGSTGMVLMLLLLAAWSERKYVYKLGKKR